MNLPRPNFKIIGNMPDDDLRAVREYYIMRLTRAVDHKKGDQLSEAIAWIAALTTEMMLRGSTQSAIVKPPASLPGLPA